VSYTLTLSPQHDFMSLPYLVVLESPSHTTLTYCMWGYQPPHEEPVRDILQRRVPGQEARTLKTLLV